MFYDIFKGKLFTLSEETAAKEVYLIGCKQITTKQRKKSLLHIFSTVKTHLLNHLFMFFIFCYQLEPNV